MAYYMIYYRSDRSSFACILSLLLQNKIGFDIPYLSTMTFIMGRSGPLCLWLCSVHSLCWPFFAGWKLTVVEHADILGIVRATGIWLWYSPSDFHMFPFPGPSVILFCHNCIACIIQRLAGIIERAGLQFFSRRAQFAGGFPFAFLTVLFKRRRIQANSPSRTLIIAVFHILKGWLCCQILVNCYFYC